MTVPLHPCKGSMAVMQMLRDGAFGQRKRADAGAPARCVILYTVDLVDDAVRHFLHRVCSALCEICASFHRLICHALQLVALEPAERRKRTEKRANGDTDRAGQAAC